LKLINNNGVFETIQHCQDFSGDILVPIFENGHILKEWTFEEVRERAEVRINVEELV